MSKKELLASLTVEAAFVVPIFLYTILGFLYFLHLLFLQDLLQQGLVHTSIYASKLAYTYKKQLESKIENTDWISTATNYLLWKEELKNNININTIDHSIIVDGMNGISFQYSSFLEEDNIIDLILNYEVKIPFIKSIIGNIPIVQRVRRKAFVGFESDKEKDTITDSSSSQQKEIVFITETGIVYHKTKVCKYLDLTIVTILWSELEQKRNESGGKYKECERCIPSNSIKYHTIYITKYGDRYHRTLDCSGLKRTIIEISIDKVGDKRACSKCY